jgi:hypothetical protein
MHNSVERPTLLDKCGTRIYNLPAIISAAFLLSYSSPLVGQGRIVYIDQPYLASGVIHKYRYI